MYNNFEISLVVFMPNITTNHAITYTNISTRKYYIGEILFCGVWRRYVSQNIVAITGNLLLNKFTLLYVFN